MKLRIALRPLAAALALAALLPAAALAQEAVIRKALAERLPQLPKIDEISRTPVPGLWEVRYGGSEIIYADDKGDYIFANGVGLALWIGGADAAECCVMTGGPYIESRFFGEGIGLVLRREDETLRRAFDFALQRLWDEGKYAEIYLRFFPVSPF